MKYLCDKCGRIADTTTGIMDCVCDNLHFVNGDDGKVVGISYGAGGITQLPDEKWLARNPLQ